MAALVAPLFASLGLGATAAGIAGNLTASLLLSAASRALAPKGNLSQADVVRGLQVPTSLPPKRFVYGKTRVYGSWAAMKVKDGVFYGCLIFNSRPSDGGERVIYLDKRAVTLTGDVLNFATGGSASNAPFAGYAKFWLGLGAQSGPPAQIMAEAGDATSTDPDLFWPSDRWRGLTVLWVRLDRGPNASRTERWPRTPPEVEIEMRWSKVYDLRDAGQDADDAATWQWRPNQALCTMDALRQNPIRRRALRQIHLESFEAAADVADQVIGGEARYEAHGVIVWDGSELIDQLAPLVAAGGGDLFQSGGRLGYAAGAYDAPEVTVSDVLRGQPFAFTRSQPARDVPRAVRARFVDPNAEYEMSELTPYPVPGGGGYDGGDDGLEDLTLTMVKSSTQAQRLQKAKAILASLQRRIACELPPSCLNLIAGSVMEIDLPRVGDARNGVYKITTTHPAKWLESDDGVAFRLPIEAREVSAAVWAWDPSEAVAPITSAFTPINLALAAPTDLDAAVAPGGVAFDLLPDGTDADSFEWQWQRGTEGWLAGGVIDAALVNGLGRVPGFLAATVAGAYLIRVRSVRGARLSAWLTLASAVTVGSQRYLADFQNANYRIDGLPGVIGNVVSVTRAGTATFVDGTGVLRTAAANVARVDHSTGLPCLLFETAGTNAFTFSEDLTNAVYTLTNATVTANTSAAPSNAVTADALVETVATGQHKFLRACSFVSGTAKSISFFAKASGRVDLRIRAAGAGFATRSADVNISTGAVTIVAGPLVVLQQALANGWRLFTMQFTPTATVAGEFEIYLCNAPGVVSYTGDGVSGALLWGIQDGAGSYIPTTTAAGSRLADVPGMQGVSAPLNLTAVYDDGSTASFAAAPVLPGYWPTLTRNRLRSLTGTT